MSEAVTFLLALITLAAIALLRSERDRRAHDLLALFGFIVFLLVAGVLRSLPGYFFPSRVLDSQLLALDRHLAFDPILFARWFQPHVYVVRVLQVAYASLGFVIVLVWAIEQDFVMRRAVLLRGILCGLFYVAFPAVGPAHYDFLRGMAAATPRNCMPSMHFGWALLIAMNARNSWLRNSLWIYSALIAIATIALGEHYLVDLLAALPYVLVIQWAAESIPGVGASSHLMSKRWTEPQGEAQTQPLPELCPQTTQSRRSFQ